MIISLVWRLERLRKRIYVPLLFRSALHTMGDLRLNNPFAKSPDVESLLLEEFQAAGSHQVTDAEGRLSRLKSWLSLPPQYTTVRVNTRLTSTEAAKNSVQRYLNESYSALAPHVVCHPFIPDLLVLAGRQSPCHLQPSSREVVVRRDCAEAVLRGAHVYVPGIMGAPKGLQAGQQVAVYGDLDGQCLKGRTRPYRGRRVFIGNGTTLVSRADIFVNQVSEGCAVQMTEPLSGCPPLGGLEPSQLFLQNLPSALCGHILAPKPGDTVLDMCAAPGGKTTHLATLMNDTGLVVALDRSENRVSKIRSNCERWQISCVQAFVHDANEFDSLPRQGTEIPDQFDCILLDAPCSALGGRPRLSYEQSAKALQSYPPQQRALLETAVRLLKPGGLLLYSTCSLSTAENEAIVAWALRRFPQIHLVEQKPHIGGIGRAGAGLDEDQRCLVQRFEGDHLAKEGCDYDVDTIGFFIALFRKGL
ncbi:tRNA (cytosine(72)-C(5))-methyltransferase NSUN6-like isoform X2 [Dermacentor silvarum]|uniref:tRNA (cytosine(72)-C(5))-methyltransferase NSUN6-like isoform X2 n=1 Tax=Dermacentor silvarum TaxID=543639 RepID=UPI002101A651|nr:tRNA (cytosine(72)-C(5))-methyltransferase NSUN6-like isoform X2 [Dermacentor silvarum]